MDDHNLVSRSRLMQALVATPPMRMTVRLRPAMTRHVSGSLLFGEYIACAQESLEGLAPREFGIDRDGWYDVDPEPMTLPPVPEMLVFKVNGVRRLPPWMELSSYDVGHEVVVLAGESMGQRGRVYNIFGSLTTVPSYSLGGVATHWMLFLGAVLPQDRHGIEVLAPIPERFPPGTPVWLLRNVTWEPAVVTEFSHSQLTAYLLDSQQVVRQGRDRDTIRERTDEMAPPVVVQRRISLRDNVPPAGSRRQLSRRSA